MSYTIKRAYSCNRRIAQRTKYPLEGRVNFEEIRRASLSHILPILRRFLPDGRIKGSNYFARNPKRNDKSLGSFSINYRNGRWADFSVGASGGDVISLCAYLYDLSQKDAAKHIAGMVGL